VEELTIGEVARLTGIRTSALRYYEEEGLLPAPRRVNGRRRYSPSILLVLAVLRFAQQAGFTLAEIRTLLHGFGADMPLGASWESLARAKLAELDALIARATQMKRAIAMGLECGCLRIEDCILTDVLPPDAPDSPAVPRGITRRGEFPLPDSAPSPCRGYGPGVTLIDASQRHAVRSGEEPGLRTSRSTYVAEG
jgi:MerR family transcriptional regulator, redox-sensitive transcriptional activator SoxR